MKDMKEKKAGGEEDEKKIDTAETRKSRREKINTVNKNRTRNRGKECRR